ncbi:MAG: AAA family ATPase [Mucinivorans sp.]
MLTHLHIENYAIIEHLDLDLYPGLNTITGQTGAGKSILLGALGLLAGGKAEQSVIGVAGEQMVVEGEFDISRAGLESFFQENELDYSPQIVVRRVVSRSSKGRAFVDTTPVGVALLRDLVGRLVDIHSQHQTLLVVRADFQREILDALSADGGLWGRYTAQWGAYRTAQSELQRVVRAAAAGAERSEFLLTHIEHIEALKLKAGECKALEQEQAILSNAEDIATDLAQASSVMEDDEQGVLLRVKTIVLALTRAGRKFSSVASLADRVNSVQIELRDIAQEVDSIGEQVTSNPERLIFINERLDSIYSVMKSEQVQDGTELLARLEEFKKEYMAIEGGETIQKQMAAAVDKELAALNVLADRLSEERAAAAVQVTREVESSLGQLGMVGAQFKVEITPAEQLSQTGRDIVRFMFAGGAKQELLPLDKVASGGEMSRVMLSLKALVARSMQLPTIIFDEIDTGVSGAVADAMGSMVEAMGQGLQVINITHLAQVAAKGDHHFLVYKDNGTHIKELAAAERQEQIAAMLSGADVSDAARAQAATLLAKKR